MVTLTGLVAITIIPIIIATAIFGLAVEGTEVALKKAGHAIISKFHKKPIAVKPVQ